MFEVIGKPVSQKLQESVDAIPPHSRRYGIEGRQPFKGQ